LPAGLQARNASDVAEGGRIANIERYAAVLETPRPGRHEYCPTTVRELESGPPNAAGQKPPGLSPAPDETGEIILEDATAMPQLPSQPPYEDLNDNDARRQHHHRSLIERLRKLGDGCESVVGIHLKGHELRGSIRRERRALTDIDARFMQEVRNVLLRSPNEKFQHLLDLYEEMDSRRNLLLPKEDDYNILEDQMNTQEFELEEAGRKVLEVLEGVRNSLFSDGDVHSFLEDNADLQSATSRGNESLRPEQREYLSRIGDLDLVEARLSELQRKRAELVEHEKSRILVGLVLNEESRKFLDAFDDNHALLQEERALIVHDIEKMRKTLESTNRVLFSATQFDDPEATSEPVPDSVPPVTQYPSPHSTVNPLLSSTVPEQSHTSPTLEAVKSDSIPQEPLLFTEEDKTETYPHLADTESRHLRNINSWLAREDARLSRQEMTFPAQFINDWFLSKLRNSRSEIYQYKRAPVLQTINISQEELKDLVLRWWWSDDAAADYLKTRKMEALRLSVSSRAVMSNRGAQSDTVLIDMNRLASCLYRDQAMLQVSRTNMKITIRRTRSI
jgi:hypothetical protein